MFSVSVVGSSLYVDYNNKIVFNSPLCVGFFTTTLTEDKSRLIVAPQGFDDEFYVVTEEKNTIVKVENKGLLIANHGNVQCYQDNGNVFEYSYDGKIIKEWNCLEDKNIPEESFKFEHGVFVDFVEEFSFGMSPEYTNKIYYVFDNLRDNIYVN